MTDETKKLFDAPWKRAQNLSRNGSGATRGFSPSRIVDASNNNVAYAYPTMPKGKQKITANRLARLPELYDALIDEATEKCNECLHENLRMGRIPFTGKYDFIEAGCPFKDEQCHTASHLDLLKKVRDGE